MIPGWDDPSGQAVVPGRKGLEPGTQRAIIRHAGFGVEEFLGLV
jgi:hypothetical protein